MNLINKTSEIKKLERILLDSGFSLIEELGKKPYAELYINIGNNKCLLLIVIYDNEQVVRFESYVKLNNNFSVLLPREEIRIKDITQKTIKDYIQKLKDSVQ